MSTEETSKYAYITINETGYRAKVGDLVLAVLARSPAGLTGAEINAAVKPGANRRLSELERAGLVHREGVRPCSVSSLTAAVWHHGGKTR